MKTEKKWFASWFDSKYYHILYQNRDEQEAGVFMDNLVAHLDVKEEATIWDLACGKGRHSIYLAQKGFDVTGADLSEESIAIAQNYEHERLSFFQHDMRKYFRVNYFDYVFNLFTSFGYFDNQKDHLDTLENVALAMRPSGTFVMDFMNAHLVKANLVRTEQKTLSGINFDIQRNIENGYIIKTISFEADGQAHKHQERVRAFEQEELMDLFQKAGLTVQKTFGDYKLNNFDKTTSPRLILIAEK